MFAPDGYTPLSDIMKLAAVETDELREWSQTLLAKSVGDDQTLDEDFFKHRASGARIYSFKELFEKAFNESVEQFDIYVCHPEKGTWRFGFPVLHNLVGYRHLFLSNEIDADTYFGDGLDWPFYEDMILDLVRAKSDPWYETFSKLPHTSPNLFYNRDTYTIDLKAYDEIARNHPYGLPVSHLGYPFDVHDIRPFQGWALCTRSDFSFSKFRERFLDAFARDLCRALFGDWFIEEYAEGQVDVWRRFIGLEGCDDLPDIKNTIATETAAFKEMDTYVAEHEEVGTKAEIKERFGKNLGERAFERVWDRLRVQHPRLSVPGRRKKT